MSEEQTFRSERNLSLRLIRLRREMGLCLTTVLLVPMFQKFQWFETF
jgi:hypothetical protein